MFLESGCCTTPLDERNTSLNPKLQTNNMRGQAKGGESQVHVSLRFKRSRVLSTFETKITQNVVLTVFPNHSSLNCIASTTREPGHLTRAYRQLNIC